MSIQQRQCGICLTARVYLVTQPFQVFLQETGQSRLVFYQQQAAGAMAFARTSLPQRQGRFRG
jgi:hypothetical protein